MTVLYGQQMTKLVSTPNDIPDPGFVHGTVRVFNEEITLASQTTSDTIQVAQLPKGAIPLFAIVQSDTSLGSSTIALGITGTVAKYKAAATFTTINIPVFVGVTAAMGEQLSADEVVFITIAAATLPASGTLRIQFFYAWN